MYKELEGRTPERFEKVLFASFTFLFFIFFSVASIAYMLFGEHVSPNVLSNMGLEPAGAAARLGMVVVVLSVYPIMMKPMTAPLESVMSPFPLKIATVAIIVSAMFTSYFVTSLGLMNVISGTLSVSGFVGLAPGLVGLYLTDRRLRARQSWRCGMYFLIVASLGLSVLGIFYTDNYDDELHARCLWMIKGKGNSTVPHG